MLWAECESSQIERLGGHWVSETLEFKRILFNGHVSNGEGKEGFDTLHLLDVYHLLVLYRNWPDGRLVRFCRINFSSEQGQAKDEESQGKKGTLLIISILLLTILLIISEFSPFEIVQQHHAHVKCSYTP